jgi:2-polyprenyl-3-methyl-5-hydroxy-6-metoxy-1,4-benzoquinol methylase
MVAPLLNGSAEAVFGSRMMEQGAARRGGMPLYKLVGNKILTRWENAMAGTDLSEWHSGYRAYSVSALQKLALQRNSDGFDFDTQIILQLHASGARIMEIPIPTYYGDEICHVDGLKYGRQVMVETFRYRLHKMGLGSGKYIPQNHAYEIKTSADSSHGVLLRQLSKKSPCRVLDVGCSDGALGERIRALGHVVVGIDVECHELVKGRLDNFIQADLDQGLPKDIPGLFDVVLCADVVEHVRQPDVLLSELRAVVAPGGSVLVSIPNFGHWYPRVRTMFGLFDYDRRGILDRTHVRFFTHRSFKRLAQTAGYSVQRVACTGFPFDVLSRGNTKIPKFIIAPLRVIDMALVKLRPPLFAYQFIYELKP